MKFVSALLLSLLFTSASYAGDIYILGLQCRAVNGGTLNVVRETRASLVVQGSFGFSQKEYIAHLSELNEGSASRIVLLNKQGGPELEVRATLDPQNQEPQRVSANISFVRMPFMGVSATCDIRVGPYR